MPPTPAEGVVTVHGHVLDPGLEPVPGVQVHLVDRTGKRIRGAGSSTDADGYFALEWTPRAGRAGEAEPAARLRVAAGTSRVLHEEPRPRVRRAGAVEYTEIVLAEDR